MGQDQGVGELQGKDAKVNGLMRTNKTGITTRIRSHKGAQGNHDHRLYWTVVRDVRDQAGLVT